MLTECDFEIVNGVKMTKYLGPKNTKLFLVHTMEEWRAFFQLLMQQKFVACDTETSGFSWFAEDRIVGMSFGWDNTDFYIPVRHLDSLTGGVCLPQLDMDVIRPDLQTFFAQEEVITLWHNSRFDRHFYAADGIDILTEIHDTLFMWKLYNESASAALKDIASGWYDEMGIFRIGIVGRNANAKEKEISIWRQQEAKARRQHLTALVKEKVTELSQELEYQGYKKNDLKKHVKEVIFKDHPYKEASKDDIHYGFIPIELMTEYAAIDTYLTRKVFEHVINKISFTGAVGELYKTELELSDTLFYTEKNGIRCNVPYLREVTKEFTKKVADMEASLSLKLGQINLASSQQLTKALLHEGVPLKDTTRTGALSVGSKVLAKYEHKFPVVEEVLKLKKAVKLKTAFFDSLSNRVDERGYVYPVFNQNVRTGRMSCSAPNMQQIPRDTAVRDIFVVPNSDYVYVLIDYSQVEVRLTAHYSQCPVLLEAYRTGKDVHCKTSASMFGIDYDEMVEVIKKEDKSDPRFKRFKEIRNIGKTLNFAMIYGVSHRGLAEQIPRPEQYQDMSEEEWVNQCSLFMDMYFHVHPKVKSFIKKYARMVESDRKVLNYFGRTRNLHHVNATKLMRVDTEEQLKKARAIERGAKRQGVNFVVQSTAGDVFKKAVVRASKILKGTKSYIPNLVHDEIQLYIHKDDIHLVSKIKDAMEDFEFSVPLIAEVSFSTTSWGQKVSL